LRSLAAGGIVLGVIGELREVPMRHVLAIALMGLVAAFATQAQTTSAPTAFDACGSLVQGAHCVLFDGGGGKYVLSDYGGFHLGDAVRVVGTLDPGCTTICTDSDGCISGAAVYDPVRFPCGQDIPSFPSDLVTGVCSAASAALSTATVVGLWFSWRRPGPSSARQVPKR
jgi:hypothetical protein